MKEEYRFLNLNGERIFAGLHNPILPTSRAIVMCHPLGEEKLWAHRVFVSFARDMAARGFTVMRFDFRGEGDSDGEFEDVDFETRIHDAVFAVDTVLELNPLVTEVTLVGLRLGASVAAAAAARRGDIAHLILWDPVVDGSAYVQTVLRLNLMFQMALHRKVIENREVLVSRLASGGTVNIEGYELATSLFRQLSDFRLSEVLSSYTGETLVVQINQVPTVLKPELTELADINKQCQILAVQEEPFWKEIKTFYQRATALTYATRQVLEIHS